MSEQKVFQLGPREPTLSNAERERLLKVARLREKVGKSAAAERSARLLADFEQQLASICKRRRENPSVKRPGSPVAPE
jgi:hypothetical protein